MALTGREGALKIKEECEFFDEINEHLGHRDAVDVTNMHLESSLPYLEDEKQVGDKLKRKAENQPKQKNAKKKTSSVDMLAEQKNAKKKTSSVDMLAEALEFQKSVHEDNKKSATGVYGDWKKWHQRCSLDLKT